MSHSTPFSPATAELLVSISLLFGLLTRFGAILATVLALQLYVGLAYTEWIWTYGMLVLGILWWLLFEVVLASITNYTSASINLNFANFLSSFPLAVLFGVLIGAIFMQWHGHYASRQPS